jgi:hypothetical protein
MAHTVYLGDFHVLSTRREFLQYAMVSRRHIRFNLPADTGYDIGHTQGAELIRGRPYTITTQTYIYNVYDDHSFLTVHGIFGVGHSI